MNERWFRIICITAGLMFSAGCASDRFRATELPQRYAARQIRDYSQLDIARYASPVDTSEAINPGDQLTVSLNTGTHTEDANLEWKVSVDQNGESSLPNIGAVKLAGLTRAEAEKHVVKASLERDVFRTPTVEIDVVKKRERTVNVSGAVASPGPVAIRGDEITLADVLARAGGLIPEASGKINISGGGVELETTVPNEIAPVGMSRSEIPARTVSLESSRPEELMQISVPDGALVQVESVPPRPIQISGVIQNQTVELPAGQNIRLLDALALSGGPTFSNWISDRITVIRKDPQGNRTIQISASVRRARKNAAENILLAAGDNVVVEENLVTFTLSTLSGLIGAGANAARIGI